MLLLFSDFSKIPTISNKKYTTVYIVFVSPGILKNAAFPRLIFMLRLTTFYGITELNLIEYWMYSEKLMQYARLGDVPFSSAAPYDSL